ncbi:hypothetical protein CSE16_01015 [Solibacillus sp. R5-41]|uniref:FIVAR domain-containing protein n=1 Tax=Solibacillus sp. R5-41 TaxID=2048654 RepID=UPI000C12912E|nr:FIVAR domain-containing protein [Solibacillus sp. R5-41]ATP38724.1 hypothetical protein CSE16_01015 [Solibacillus sp. R5-41]
MKGFLVSAVSSAQAVVNNYYGTQEQIVSALNNLEIAISTYKNAQKYGLSGYTGDKSTLTNLINSVQYVTVSWNNGSDLSSNTAWTTQADQDALISAVSSAQTVLNNYSASQYDVTNAINNLNNAISTYKNAQKYGPYGNGYYGDKSWLSSLLGSVNTVNISYTGNGQDVYYNEKWTTLDAYNNFMLVVDSARSVSNSSYASQDQINAAVSDLQNAINIYSYSQSYGSRSY